MNGNLRVKAVAAAFALILPLCGCSWLFGSDDTDTSGKASKTTGDGRSTGADRASVYSGGSSGGWFLFLNSGPSPDAADSESKSGIGVNGFLWRASLDTISFMPLASADPFGGVIITEWYQTADAPDERVKVTIYILDRRLRADGVRVAVFRQVRQGAQWVDAAVAADTAPKIENAILTRARQMHIDIAG